MKKADTMTLENIMIQNEETLARGWSAGNFDSAYTSEHFEKAWKDQDEAGSPFHLGYLLGFYSTYELHEIENPEHKAMVKTLRQTQAAKTLGLVD